MPVIPQRGLRNNVADVLRRAERGERFTITVSGRAVAELGPLQPKVETRGARPLGEVLAEAPVDARWAADVERLREGERDDANDPWRDRRRSSTRASSSARATRRTWALGA